jgi:hypothetical protein
MRRLLHNNFLRPFSLAGQSWDAVAPTGERERERGNSGHKGKLEGGDWNVLYLQEETLSPAVAMSVTQSSSASVTSRQKRRQPT